ncbi:MAG: DUF4062 domain-containing protein [Clostridia bacterium]|nr:DUF4062 domain-containing protein [Clostridia bacterium]
MKSVFVSSTFIDMQNERDMLSSRVIPLVNETVQRYGESVSLCDLRWGINTSSMTAEESSRRILDICLNEIDNCRPYMIVFLGERYGWTPGEELVKFIADSHSQMELDSYDISATALEIEYGAFFNPSQLNRTLFYFRTIEGDTPSDVFFDKSEENQKKLQHLKERIKSIPGVNLCEYTISYDRESNTYSGYDGLATAIANDLLSLIEPDLKSQPMLSPLEKEYAFHFKYAKDGFDSFYDRHTEIERANFYLEENLPFFIVRGNIGKGNTAFMRRLVCDRNESGSFVIPVFCGATEISCDYIKITEFLIKILHRVSKEPLTELPSYNDTVSKWRECFEHAMLLCSKLEKKIEIFVDAIELTETGSLSNLPFFTDKIPDNISIIFSSSSVVLTGGLPSVVCSCCLDFFDARRIISRLLSNTRKELDERVLKAIFKKKGSVLPLYLEIILHRLSMMEREDFDKIRQDGGDIEAIVRHQISIVESCDDTLEGLSAQFIKLAGDKINPQLCQFAMSCICSSRYGISEERLKRVYEGMGNIWPSLDFRILMSYLSVFIFVDEFGFYKLKHFCVSNSFKMSESAYSLLIDELRREEEMADSDVSAYIFYCVKNMDASSYLELFFSSACTRDVFCASSVSALSENVHKLSSHHDQSRLLEKWAQNLKTSLDSEYDKDCKESFFHFFLYDMCKALLSDAFIWRVMAYTFLGNWATVDAYQSYSKGKGSEEIEINCDYYYELYKKYEELRKRLPPVKRQEILIIPEERHNEIQIQDKLYYFFDVPAKDDATLFLMCNDYVVLTFHRSSVGDRCTYDIRYDEESGHLTVMEADFCHYDIETYVSIYDFPSPSTDFLNYELTGETKKGMFALPYFFPIK